MVSLLFAYAVNVALSAIGFGAIRVPGVLTVKEVSEKYMTLVTPSDWAFTLIWSYIFFFESVMRERPLECNVIITLLMRCRKLFKSATENITKALPILI